MRSRILVAVVAAAVAASCDGGPTQEPESPAFAVNMDARLELARGQEHPITVAITRTGGFAGAVDLSVTGLPTGAELAPGSAMQVPAGSSSATVRVRIRPEARLDSSEVQVAARATGLQDRVATGRLVITGVDSLIVSVVGEFSVRQAETVEIPVFVSRGSGYAEPVTLSVVGVPIGATATFDPQVVPTTQSQAVLRITTTGGTPVGVNQLAVSGTGARPAGYTLGRSFPLFVTQGIARIALLPTEAYILPGERLAVSAVAYDFNDQPVANPPFVWSGGGSGIAVSPSGVVTALNEAGGFVQARVGTVSGGLLVNVWAIDVRIRNDAGCTLQVSLFGQSSTLAPGQSAQREVPLTGGTVRIEAVAPPSGDPPGMPATCWYWFETVRKNGALLGVGLWGFNDGSGGGRRPVYLNWPTLSSVFIHTMVRGPTCAMNHPSGFRQPCPLVP
jgi:hypothetical protein